MKLSKNFTLISLIFILSISYLWIVESGEPAFVKKLEVPSIPSGINIEKYYFSGFGMDHHYLWKVHTESEMASTVAISEIDAEPVTQRSTSGCLGLAQNQAPDWWPANDLEDALWDYTNSKYSLYRKRVSSNETICIYKEKNSSYFYIQWFDT